MLICVIYKIIETKFNKKKEINYGFEWKEKPVFYFHMATEGHLVSLLRRNPKVAVSIYE